jgi:hypothetical protein
MPAQSLNQTPKLVPGLSRAVATLSPLFVGFMLIICMPIFSIMNV